MKNFELHVAKLSRFKTGPSISVWYVWFLHATRDILTDRPAYSVHHCAQLFRVFFSISVCKLQNEEMYAHAPNFQLHYDFQQAKLKSLWTFVENVYLFNVALDSFWYLDACGRETYQTVCCVLILPYFYERTLAVLSVKNYKHTHALEYFSHEARSRMRLRKSTTAGNDRNAALWSIVCSISEEELARGRTAALYNRTSFSFVASQDLVSVDTFHWRPAELEDYFWEERVSSRREESAVASDCWFARAFLYDFFFTLCNMEVGNAVCLVRGRPLATDICLAYE